MTTTLPDIERALRLLHMSGVRDTLETRVLQAQGSQQPFLETFALILQDELDRRRSRLIEHPISSPDSRRSSRLPKSTGPSTRSCHGKPVSRCIP
ncbi:hypothetical protein CBA19CS42_30405 [Caballeronia novacaledonica]|uniref:IstB ATP binding domain-containing protein n=1 Tax=Caballeronia novacaledonica TaxID=1544861 RepID=A0AA37MUD4_9BURK|nr:hypothetical protein CBA19CS42_30405 [Caballeronia novacaledonica]